MPTHTRRGSNLAHTSRGCRLPGSCCLHNALIVRIAQGSAIPGDCQDQGLLQMLGMCLHGSIDSQGGQDLLICGHTLPLGYQSKEEVLICNVGWHSSLATEAGNTSADAVPWSPWRAAA